MVHFLKQDQKQQLLHSHRLLQLMLLGMILLPCVLLLLLQSHYLLLL
jgi:hypothetical protein